MGVAVCKDWFGRKTRASNAILSKEERIRGFEILAESNKGTGMALVLGVQADDTAGMLEYARIAESLEP